MSNLINFWSKNGDNNNLKLKLLLVGGGVLTLAAGVLLYQHRPSKQEGTPNLDTPYSFFFGNLQFVAEAHHKKKGHELIYEAFVKSKAPVVNMSFPERTCRLLSDDPEIIKFVFETEFESFEKGEEMESLCQTHQRYFLKKFIVVTILSGTQFADEENMSLLYISTDVYVFFWTTICRNLMWKKKKKKKQWKMHRKAASRMFSMRNLKEYMFSCALSGSQRTVAKLKELKDMDQFKESGVDISDILGRFTLDSFIEICFGRSLEIVESAPNEHAFSQAFDESIHICSARSVDLFWKWKKSLSIGNEQLVKKNEKILNEFVYRLLDIDTRRRLIDESGVDKHDIISLYLSMEPKITRKELRDVALNMIIAGRDTTRLLLSWFFYAIENKPKILEKIREEINAISTSDISYTQASEGLKYTECVLLETLRLYPPVGWSWRYARQDMSLPEKNFHMRKGDSLSVQHWAMGRSTAIWGKDALIFDPMRWYAEGINTKTPYEFVQFHIPPRVCLGRQFALLEAKTFLFYFFKNFNFKAKISRPISYDHNEDHAVLIPYSSGALLQMSTGYYLTLTTVD
ncbi:cytochrome P450 [Reticulomyxa filosa]|uniref:Cytochrome P450 n=1 Tax=Reticulomyxa filosa TaxID=46433 RepID=X6PBG4_RETFI|nr:cytochrome P450 [Reticulomyxa filosa]|eukprot:ETO35521.1 cytochrome P450 [Reticulomyxa filosa]